MTRVVPCLLAIPLAGAHTRGDPCARWRSFELVLSPLGLALVGRQEGDVMEWPTYDGVRRLRVERVIFQPEAWGDFSV